MNKRKETIKEHTFSSAVAVVESKKSLLPKDALDILQQVNKNGYLKLSFQLVYCYIICFVVISIKNEKHRRINDSMIPELCEWLIKLGDQVKTLE